MAPSMVEGLFQYSTFLRNLCNLRIPCTVTFLLTLSVPSPRGAYSGPNSYTLSTGQWSEGASPSW